VKKKFVSIDHTYKHSCKTELHDTKKILSDNTKYSIRGTGSSLSAASFGPGLTVLEQNPKYNFIDIDTDNNQINVSAQLTLFEVFKFLTPKKFHLKSVPSYPMATVGGCIAYNAHGQNHYRDGCFGNHVREITLYHPRYGDLTLSNKNRSDLFELTINGFGLTGIIKSARIEIYKLTSNTVTVTRIPYSSLKESFDIFMKYKDSYDFYHTWTDLMNPTIDKQNGFIELAKINKNDFDQRNDFSNRYSTPLSSFWPVNIFGTKIMKFVNQFYYKSKIKTKFEVTSLFNFQHPSFNKMYYFSMFGNKGLFEHQTLIPTENIKLYLKDFIKLVCYYKPIISLCHTKLFGNYSHKMSFTGKGYAIAFHVPNNSKHKSFLGKVDKLDCQFNCKSNIIKDSRLTTNVIYQQYGSDLNDFKTKLINFDPNKIFSNRISETLFCL
jgi:hypothetical protein